MMYIVPLYQRALEMHQKKQVEIKRAKEELSKEDAGGYVGKPKINEMSKSMQRSIENLCRWGESRNEKLTRMKSEIEHREQKEYTFQPQISNKAKKVIAVFLFCFFYPFYLFSFYVLCYIRFEVFSCYLSCGFLVPYLYQRVSESIYLSFFFFFVAQVVTSLPTLIVLYYVFVLDSL